MLYSLVQCALLLLVFASDNTDLMQTMESVTTASDAESMKPPTYVTRHQRHEHETGPPRQEHETGSLLKSEKHSYHETHSHHAREMLKRRHEATEGPPTYITRHQRRTREAGSLLKFDKKLHHGKHNKTYWQHAPIDITTAGLVEAEKLFVDSRETEHDHGNIGGDRMSKSRHNYAPIYSKYLPLVLDAAEVPTVAEVGILTGTGLAMWNALFPQSRIYGFDLNTSSYKNNLAHLQSQGFHDKHVHVHKLNQMSDPEANYEKLKHAFGHHRPHLVIDDGYHVPKAAGKTFLSMQPFLADQFVYLIEDIRRAALKAGQWQILEDTILEHCEYCTFSFECAGGRWADDHWCIAVVDGTNKFESCPATGCD